MPSAALQRDLWALQGPLPHSQGRSGHHLPPQSHWRHQRGQCFEMRSMIYVRSDLFLCSLTCLCLNPSGQIQREVHQLSRYLEIHPRPARVLLQQNCQRQRQQRECFFTRYRCNIFLFFLLNLRRLKCFWSGCDSCDNIIERFYLPLIFLRLRLGQVQRGPGLAEGHRLLCVGHTWAGAGREEQDPVQWGEEGIQFTFIHIALFMQLKCSCIP